MKTYPEAVRDLRLKSSPAITADQMDRFRPLLMEIIHDPETLVLLRSIEESEVDELSKKATLLVLGIRIGMEMERWEPR